MTLLILLPACSHGIATSERTAAVATPSVFTLSWPNYDGDFEKRLTADYVLNGESLGQGHAGYQRLLERMGAFPIGSTLKVQFKPHDGLGGGQGYAVPLSSENNDFWHGAESRGIKVELP